MGHGDIDGSLQRVVFENDTVQGPDPQTKGASLRQQRCNGELGTHATTLRPFLRWQAELA